MTREIPGVQEPVVRYAESLGWLAWKMKIEGRNGCPDYWFFRNGQIVIVEFKARGKLRQLNSVVERVSLRLQGTLSM